MAKTKTTKTREVQTDAGLSGLKVKSTNPKIMSEQIQRLNKMIKSVDTAGEISYDNTTSGLTASNVQAALDEVVSDLGSLEASDVSYDNTDSGLTATDVQSAIDELATFNVLATSSGSKTFAEHIAVLKAVWDTLSIDRKIKCFVKRDNTILRPQDISSGAGRFTSVIIDNQSIYLEMLRMSNSTYSGLVGSTYSDLSNQTVDQEFILYESK